MQEFFCISYYINTRLDATRGHSCTPRAWKPAGLDCSLVVCVANNYCSKLGLKTCRDSRFPSLPLATLTVLAFLARGLLVGCVFLLNKIFFLLFKTLNWIMKWWKIYSFTGILLKTRNKVGRIWECAIFQPKQTQLTHRGKWLGRCDVDEHVWG